MSLILPGTEKILSKYSGYRLARSSTLLIGISLCIICWVLSPIFTSQSSVTSFSISDKGSPNTAGHFMLTIWNVLYHFSFFFAFQFVKPLMSNFSGSILQNVVIGSVFPLVLVSSFKCSQWIPSLFISILSRYAKASSLCWDIGVICMVLNIRILRCS